jgi:hypothetical protein
MHQLPIRRRMEAELASGTRYRDDDGPRYGQLAL